MAIRQDTIVAIRKVKGENVLRIANVNSDKYSLALILLIKIRCSVDIPKYLILIFSFFFKL
ncbi:galactokinase [Phtheirospermum japonicum]|uniref:Galactokinase n=1 Tax=Phtheirospermum japonicum TaxID=374723 RepID=A0A830BPX7_9LAMI|nr:galactokinase [Phtheirospermum japonicum]